MSHDPFRKTKEEVAEKVRKLLTQAEDPAATADEAQAFTMKAQQLMTKYAIELAMVTDATHADELTGISWTIPSPYANHKVSLVGAVARSNDCRTVYTDLGGGRRRIDVVGYASDLDWVRTLSHSLDIQLMAALAAAMRERPPGVHGRTYAVGFVQGFIAEVGARLHAARREAVRAADAASGGAAQGAGGGADGASPGSSVELVLVAKARRVDDEFHVRHPGTRTVYNHVRLSSWSGFNPGRAAGRRASLARGAVGGRRSLSA